MQILLVRHGATDWNLQGRCQGSSDRHLSEVGVRQAEHLAALLRAEEIHAIYSSHLRRALQTADYISQPHKLPVLIEQKICELDHGALEGLTFNQIKENYAEFLVRWRSEPAEIRVPGGERLADVAERAWNGLNQIVQRHSEAERILVVSHNFPILGIVCRITGTHLNAYRSFHIDPCGVTRLAYDAGRWNLTAVNSREYNPTPLPYAENGPTSASK
ncbi:MAG TPA: histidine phosphatase family protein [Candidatus Binatia bacterium]|nr:histidine phosphatase family protein [Candidatus Binatia bacterium]